MQKQDWVEREDGTEAPRGSQQQHNCHRSKFIPLPFLFLAPNDSVPVTFLR